MLVAKIFLYSLLAGSVLTVIINLFKKEEHWPSAILRNTMGSLFLFSGFVKAIDPLGTAYKIGDYFEAFGFHAFLSLPTLESLAVFSSFFTIVLELVLGVALIIGWRSRITAIFTVLLVLFFTILTGYTTVTGEVTDCGCFGDFLKLEPVESFGKDVFLLILALLLLFWSSKIKPIFGTTFMRVKMIGATVFALFFCLYNVVWHLPIIDFRPYKIGNNIRELQVPVKDPVIVYRFIYKNNETGELLNLGTDELTTVLAEIDASFVERVDSIIDPGIPSKIDNYFASNDAGESVGDSLLALPGYSLWVLSKDEEKGYRPGWEALNKVSEWADKNNHHMYAYVNDKDEAFRHDIQAPYPFYEADKTFIKTIVRANPGLVLLKDGVVVGKWHHRSIPSASELEEYISQ